MQNLVSVIIPVYNAGDKLVKCVESIEFGSFDDYKIFLIDDCSTDDSWDYCVSLSNRYENVVAIKNEKNSGVSYTRNRGIELADSKYIVFVDSDDWVSEKFLKSLVDKIQKYPNVLVMCGISFVDVINNYNNNYLYDSQKEEILLEKEDYFSLVDNFFIQSPCNKIFELSILKNNNITFDANLSMGEDFLFVLEYMKSLHSDYSVVINKPLYYYLRYSDSSLMSTFGLKEKNHEFTKRLELLYEIIGIHSDKVDNAYHFTLKNTLNSYVYAISHKGILSDAEKLNLIEYVMNDGKAKSYLHEQKILILKEKVSRKLFSVKKIKNKLNNIHNKRIIYKSKKYLTNSDFSIISQNCIGGVLYNDFGLKFLSPTINLYFSTDDFMKFVLNLKYYLNLDLKMRWKEKYPIGILDDITIHFMQYSSCSEAESAWNRRKKRINFDKILVISTDMEGFDNNTFSLWKQIKYSKVLLSSTPWNDDSCIFFDKYKDYTSVPDLIPKREFYKNNIIINEINQL